MSNEFQDCALRELPVLQQAFLLRAFSTGNEKTRGMRKREDKQGLLLPVMKSCSSPQVAALRTKPLRRMRRTKKR